MEISSVLLLKQLDALKASGLCLALAVIFVAQCHYCYCGRSACRYWYHPSLYPYRIDCFEETRVLKHRDGRKTAKLNGFNSEQFCLIDTLTQQLSRRACPRQGIALDQRLLSGPSCTRRSSPRNEGDHAQDNQRVKT